MLRAAQPRVLGHRRARGGQRAYKVKIGVSAKFEFRQVSASFGGLQVSFSKFRLLASLKFWVAKFWRVVSASSASLKFRQVSASLGKSRQVSARFRSPSFSKFRRVVSASSASLKGRGLRVAVSKHTSLRGAQHQPPKVERSSYYKPVADLGVATLMTAARIYAQKCPNSHSKPV